MQVCTEVKSRKCNPSLDSVKSKTSESRHNMYSRTASSLIGELTEDLTIVPVFCAVRNLNRRGRVLARLGRTASSGLDSVNSRDAAEGRAIAIAPVDKVQPVDCASIIRTRACIRRSGDIASFLREQLGIDGIEIECGLKRAVEVVLAEDGKAENIREIDPAA